MGLWHLWLCLCVYVVWYICDLSCTSIGVCMSASACVCVCACKVMSYHVVPCARARYCGALQCDAIQPMAMPCNALWCIGDTWSYLMHVCIACKFVNAVLFMCVCMHSTYLSVCAFVCKYVRVCVCERMYSKCVCVCVCVPISSQSSVL